MDVKMEHVLPFGTAIRTGYKSSTAERPGCVAFSATNDQLYPGVE